MDWFQQNGRDLPWRATRDPYAVWLSEVILQQTRVEQGRPYWLRFMERWPRVELLAEAEEDEVMRMWQGLGYYSRARNLHEAARQVAAMGRFPDSYDALRRLKGVGDYTAAAVASIAFDEPVAVVDGNVYRVLSRYFGIDVPVNSAEGRRVFKALAQSHLPEKAASAYNQALMDFGALQCTPQSPACNECPLAPSCDALRTGRVDMLPVKEKRLKVKQRHLSYVYIRWQGKTAMRKRPSGDIWQGLWEPFLAEDDGGREQGYGLPAGAKLVKKGVKHVLTHRILLADFYLWEPESEPRLSEEYKWIAESQIDNYGVPRLVELLLQSISEAG